MITGLSESRLHKCYTALPLLVFPAFLQRLHVVLRKLSLVLTWILQITRMQEITYRLRARNVKLCHVCQPPNRICPASVSLIFSASKNLIKKQNVISSFLLPSVAIN